MHTMYLIATGVLRQIKNKQNKKARKSRILQCSNVTSFSLCLHYNKSSLARKKYPPCTNAMTLPIKCKNPSSFQEAESRVKTRTYGPKLLLPQWLFCPIISHNQIAKRNSGQLLTWACHISLLRKYCQIIFYLILCVSFLNTFCNETRTYSPVISLLSQPGEFQ